MSGAPPPQPETAAALHVLRHLGDATGGEVLKLGLRELVLRRVWRLERRERAGVLGFRSELALARGRERSPALTPLMQLDAALGAAVGPETASVKKAVQKVVRGRTARGDALLKLVREDLARQGLVRSEERKALGLIPRRRLVATPAGEAAARELAAREGELLAALADPARAARALATAGPLVLIAPVVVDQLDAELRGRSATDGGGGASGGGKGGEGGGEGGGDWSLLDALDPGIDAAVDSGGGGGDGGGGGGDGGGGDGGGG